MQSRAKRDAEVLQAGAGQPGQLLEGRSGLQEEDWLQGRASAGAQTPGATC